MSQVTIAGHRGNALREVRQALIEAGKDDGMHLVDARAYSSNTLESGWVPPRCRQGIQARR